MTQTHTQKEDCGRAGDLVAYVYGEAGEAEADDFTRHLAVCVACRAEAAAFGIVRADFAVWRTAAPELTGAHSARFVAEQTAALHSESNRAAHFAGTRHELEADAGRSLRRAWQALAELFRVTPRWAQAGGAAAALAVCALAGTSLGGLAARTPTPDVKDESANIAHARPAPNAVERIVTPNESEIESRINREVARRLAERDAADATSDARTITTASLRDDGARARPATRRSPARPRRPSTKSPAGSFEDETLPRLSDLLDGAE